MGFGVDARALTDEKSAVLENGYDFVGQFQKIAKYFKWASILPWWKRVYKYKMVEEETYKFFQGLVQNSLESREKGGSRVDFMNFLRQLKEKKQLTPNEVLSHAMMFYLDGHDTTAMAMSRILMEVIMVFNCIFFDQLAINCSLSSWHAIPSVRRSYEGRSPGQRSRELARYPTMTSLSYPTWKPSFSVSSKTFINDTFFAPTASPNSPKFHPRTH